MIADMTLPGRRLCRISRVPGLLLLAVLAGCVTAHRSKGPSLPPSPSADPTALTVMAEAALKRGDCRSAAESYTQAAAVGNAKLAMRATQVAMACEHLPAAWQ